MLHLYKYLSPERRGYLHDELLRFSQPDALNDPFELLPTISKEQASQIVETFISMPKPKPSFAGGRSARRAAERANAKADKKVARYLRDNSEVLREKFFADAKKNLNSKIGILSLSRRWDSALMWSHYTNSHTGFCVGFRMNHPIFQTRGNPLDPSRMVRPVEYSERRIPVSLVPGKPIDMKVIYTKSIDWSYEQEERVIALLSDADRRVTATPYDVCLFRVPHECIADITLGLRADVALAEEVEDLAKRFGFSVFQSTLSENSFNVERRKIYAA
jgi:hypothetical protein